MTPRVIFLAFVATVAGEAPYFSNRPPASAPSFNYSPAQIASVPAPVQQYQQPAPQHHHHQSVTQYQQPALRYQQPAPQYQQPAPQYQQPAPQYQQPTVHYQQPTVQYQQPAPKYTQPAPQYHQPAPQYHQPAPQYQQPAPQYQQPAPQYQQPAHQYLPASNTNQAPSQPQANYIQYPPLPSSNSGYNYQRPSFAPAFVQPQSAPVSSQILPAPAPAPAFIQTQTQSSAPLLQQIQYQSPQAISQLPLQTNQYQHSDQQGYSYPQPQVNSQLQLPQGSSQSTESQSSQNNFQIDFRQQNFQQQSAPEPTSANNLAQADVGSALDSTVVQHLQNTLTQHEDSYSKSLGSALRVSSVDLESAKPSIEVSAFVHNAPLTQSLSQSSQSTALEQSQSLSSGDDRSHQVSTSYGLPNGLPNGLPEVVVNRANSNSIQTNFLPNTLPATSYGVPI